MKLQSIPDKLPEFKAMPHLAQNLRKGHVYYYDPVGYTRELTPQHKQKIAELSNNHFSNSVVIAVLETPTEFGLMTSYLLISDEDTELYQPGDGSYGIVAYVVSNICEEAGSVGVKETNGLLRRVW